MAYLALRGRGSEAVRYSGEEAQGDPCPRKGGAEMRLFDVHGKNGFVTATKLGTTDNIFVMLQPKILLQQPNVLMELNILFLQQNVFAIPILTNDFVSITKPFFPCNTDKSQRLTV